jgi:enoyl-[acyl-carrier protein] reductase/trans-2-enoyl-CoA reductase (NAD+)
MKKQGTHEGEIEQKYRLFKDMIYGNERITDEEGRVRPDNLELDENVQREVEEILNSVNNENVREITDIEGFVEDFMKINGFNFDNVDYDEDVDLKKLAKLELI